MMLEMTIEIAIETPEMVEMVLEMAKVINA
jgi:hypothetical protein